MGLLKAALDATGGVLADQWKEYFYCDALPAAVLVTKGRKRTSGRSSNYKGSDNIISNGSIIAVADGQCMIIVEQGKVVEICAEPGEFTYDASTEPTIFSGDLAKTFPPFSKPLESASPSSVRLPRISGSTTSTPRSWLATSTVRRRLSPSVWWTTTSDWI